MSSALTITLTPLPVTADDLAIPGPVDIPDQPLPRPAVGQAIPAQLGSERRPVWVVGLDDEVVVVDARSPHRPSGLVGWCGSMPGFIDSIGGSRFTATGQYAFGPAPYGLTPYAVEVAADHVTATRRLIPSPRPSEYPADVRLPPIQGSPIAQGTFCDGDLEQAQQANANGYILEDFRDDPTWVQHDLSAWPNLAEADNTGWARTDQVNVEGVPVLTGDLLVRTQQGRIVDAAAPPGTARWPLKQNTAPSTKTMQLTDTDPAARTVKLRDAVWITPDGAHPAGDNPPEPRQLVSGAPPVSFPLAKGVNTDAPIGAVVKVTIDEGEIIQITPR